MNYQLIALDVDGTLLNDQYRLTEPVKETIRKVHEAGCTIVLCTGRSPISSIPVMEELGLRGKLITHNGAATVSSEDRSVLYLFFLSIWKRFCRWWSTAGSMKSILT